MKTLIRKFPNGKTQLLWVTVNWIHKFIEATRRTETSKYPEEKKSIEIPSVVASERGTGQRPIMNNQNSLESLTTEGDSPVWVKTY